MDASNGLDTEPAAAAGKKRKRGGKRGGAQPGPAKRTRRGRSRGGEEAEAEVEEADSSLDSSKMDLGDDGYINTDEGRDGAADNKELLTDDKGGDKDDKTENNASKEDKVIDGEVKVEVEGDKVVGKEDKKEVKEEKVVVKEDKEEEKEEKVVVKDDKDKMKEDKDVKEDKEEVKEDKMALKGEKDKVKEEEDKVKEEKDKVKEEKDKVKEEYKVIEEKEKVKEDAEMATDGEDAGGGKKLGEDVKEKEKVKPKDADLEKHWKVVRDNPLDFSGWTFLLQYVEHKNNIDEAREAFEDFLGRYPYCYGYWKKFSDMEKRHTNMDAAEKVLQDGLKAIALSVDLWMHYIRFTKERVEAKEDKEGAANIIRRTYEEALSACGIEYRSDKLWDDYLTWEKVHGDLNRVVPIYMRLLGVPTQGHQGQYDKFLSLVQAGDPKELLPSEDFLHLHRQYLVDKRRERVEAKAKERAEARAKAEEVAEAKDEDKDKDKDGDKDKDEDENKGEDKDKGEDQDKDEGEGKDGGKETKTAVEEADIAEKEKEREDKGEGGEKKKELMEVEKMEVTEEEVEEEAEVPDVENMKMDEIEVDDHERCFLRDKVIEKGRKIHQETEAVLANIQGFEDGIKRPYFHVKALEKSQLDCWWSYLDYSEEHESRERCEVLYERCLIACALYEEYWMRFARFMAPLDPSKCSEIYRRACRIHLRHKKPTLHMAWATFEEGRGEYDKCLEVLGMFELDHPGLLLVNMRRVNVLRRQGKGEEVVARLEHLIEGSKETEQNYVFYTLKLARYYQKVKGDVVKAKEVLSRAIERYPQTPKLYHALLDQAYSTTPCNPGDMCLLFDSILSSELNIEDKYPFSTRYLQFLEDICVDSKKLADVDILHETLRKEFVAQKKKKSQDESTSTPISTTTPSTPHHPTPDHHPTPPVPPSAYDPYNQQWANYQQNYYQQTAGYYGQYPGYPGYGHA